MNKEDWDAYFTSFKERDWEAAEGILETMAEKKESPQVHVKMGDVLRASGETAKAVASYHRAAQILRSQGQKEKCLAVYKIILALDPDNMDALTMSTAIMMELETDKTPLPAEEPSAVDTLESFSDLSIPVSERHGMSETPELFSGMSREEFENCLSEFEIRYFRDGETVVEEGSPGESMYLIRSGRAKVTAHLLGRLVVLATLEPGDVFGEVAFLTGRPRTASVAAEGPLEVFEIIKERIEAVIQKNPDVLSRLEEFYEKRIKDTVRKIKPQ